MMNASARNNSSIERFIALSEALTAHKHLAERRDGEGSLAESYYELIETAFGAERLNELLSIFGDLSGDDDSRLEQIMGDERLAEVGREIIMLWYMSSFRSPDASRDAAPKTPEQYYQGLFWPTIRAHPLGLSGGYFGYWKYPPEN